ncbi:MAG: thioredoxin family protein [Melioribacteraceae bacterium]|jgi:thiol-disulfide isomerase/thioredoxin|nr:thioredoxin family protein [Melioribacteraceae bacterium]
MDIAITALVIIGFMIILKVIMQKRAQKSQGKSIDASLFDDEIKTLLSGNKSILYFFSPTCGVCKSQAPIIDKLKEEFNLVGKIDLSLNQNAAQEFGILGTPTTILMKGNIVNEVFVGLKKFDVLKSKFEIL